MNEPAPIDASAHTTAKRLPDIETVTGLVLSGAVAAAGLPGRAQEEGRAKDLHTSKETR